MTENIKNLANEVTGTGKELAETVKSRFQNPLIGSVIISMLLFLWKPILFLIFSDKPIEERIAFVESNYQYGWYFLIPISIAVFYVVAIPYIMWGIGKVLNKAKRGIDSNDKNQKERDIETEIELQEKKKELLSRKNTNETIDNLNAELKNKELEIKNLNEKNKSFQTDLTIRLEKEQKQNDALRRLEADNQSV